MTLISRLFSVMFFISSLFASSERKEDDHMHTVELSFPCAYSRDDVERYLYDAFCDTTPQLIDEEPMTIGEQHSIWRVQLDWPRPKFLSSFVDPRLLEGLRDVWPEFSQPSDFPRAYREHARYGESLNDNWTLFYWSQWYIANKAKLARKTLTVIHLDDHLDLMSPLVSIREDGRVEDILTGKLISIDDPESIRAGIHSGSIGIGNFLTLFLYEMHRHGISVKLLHAYTKLPPEAAVLHKDLKIIGKVDEHFSHRPRRPESVRVEPEEILEGTVANCAYVAHHLLKPLMSHLDEQDDPVLVHIDLDYFNNRYDRDSDWESRPRIHDPLHTTTNIRATLELLRASPHSDRLEGVFVAYCPGFFPAEFWREAKRLIDEIF